MLVKMKNDVTNQLPYSRNLLVKISNLEPEKLKNIFKS